MLILHFRISLEQQEVEIRQLKSKVETLETRINRSNDEIKEQYEKFITEVKEKTKKLSSTYESVKVIQMCKSKKCN